LFSGRVFHLDPLENSENKKANCVEMFSIQLIPSRWRAAIVRLQSQSRYHRRRQVQIVPAVVELLECRTLLSTFTVSNLNDSGSGSLRNAITAANSHPGADLINFHVAGTIQLKGSTLPVISDALTIDGTTAPGFGGSPVIQIDYHGFGGLKLNSGSSGSSILGLGLKNASDNGVTLNGVTNDVIASNLITNNRLDGIKLLNSSNSLIGHSDSVTGISYYNTNDISLPINAWQGIRGTPVAGQYLLCGTSGVNGILYVGSIDGTSGKTYTVNYPDAMSTSVYGPDYLGQDSQGNDIIRLVGSYKPPSSSPLAESVQGFVFEGTFAQLGTAANYRTITVSGAKYDYVHSTMGEFAVGNYDGPTAVDPLGAGNAYLYHLATDGFTPIAYPNAVSTTAYGIWFNGGTSYTIAGGYVSTGSNGTVGNGYLVNYDSTSDTFSHWTSFSFPAPVGQSAVTHFEGISSVQNGIFTVSADFANTSGVGSAAMTVVRNIDGSFGTPQWTTISYPGAQATSNNSIYGNQVVGVATVGNTVLSYQATINSGFQLSNVINSNGTNGIELSSSNNNVIQMNDIGTDVSGNVARANKQNGILVTNRSRGNLIGGEATDGNDPTSGVFVRPPQGNLISGNGADGVLINNQSTGNQLSGNFIGTSASGNASLGNKLNGVSFVGADNNSLLGVQDGQSPFIYYNVIGGNRGNGIEIKNSNHTTIFANFLGLGANDQTPVPNLKNGLLVDGSSAYTDMGGNIPLGNVSSANGQNGVEIRDTASYFTSYNTFAGIAAFRDATNLGNGNDGFLISSTGGHILIRTCLISENDNDGIEITGRAQGVLLAENFLGLDATGTIPLGNKKNGLEISGSANNIVLGAVLGIPSITIRNIISANGRDGVYIHGNVSNVQLNDAFIGTDLRGTQALGNHGAGVEIMCGGSDITIGLTGSNRPTLISGNLGDGVMLLDTRNVTIQNTSIGTTNPTIGSLPLPNGGNGVLSSHSHNILIGGTTTGSGNTIAYNGLNGVAVVSGQSTGIHKNSIFGNTRPGIDLRAGANHNQSAPVLNSAIKSTTIKVSGTLASQRNTTYTVELFASKLTNGEGRYYLGSITVTTNGKGVGTFVYVGALPPVGFDQITATATDPLNRTSEFSSSRST
jgi:hypothetical protein